MTFLISGGALPVAVLGLLVAMLVCLGTARATGRGPQLAWRGLAMLLWATAFAGVAFLTLWLANPNGGGVNLVPGATIEGQFNQRNGLAAFNLLGNAAMLVPFGLLARPAWRWTWLQTTVAAGAVAATIEILQWLTGRSADVDDVLLNTAGAAVAAAIAVWIDRRRPESVTMPIEPTVEITRPLPESSLH